MAPAEPSPDVSAFLDALQAQGRPLHHREALAGLLTVARDRKMTALLLDAAFHAKFVVRSQEIMRRIGAGADGFDKLAAEFQSSLEKVSTLLRTLVKESDERTKRRIADDFLSVNEGALARILALCEDLARVKNWEVDGKPLPFGAPVHPSAVIVAARPWMRIVRTSRVAFALFLCFLVVDPPVLTLGWIIAAFIAGMFLVIEYEAFTLRQSKDT